MTLRDKFDYLEFEIRSPDRIAQLTAIFEAFARVKRWQFDDAPELNDDNVPPDIICEETDSRWLAFLDEPAQQWFADTFDYESEEGKTYLALWELTEPRIRHQHPMLVAPGNWSWQAVVASILSAEFLLIDLVVEATNLGVLYFEALAWPFGGTDSLAELIWAFGQHVTFNSDRKGPHLRPQSAWDYTLAKKLVAQRKGL